MGKFLINPAVRLLTVIIYIFGFQGCASNYSNADSNKNMQWKKEMEISWKGLVDIVLAFPRQGTAIDQGNYLSNLPYITQLIVDATESNRRKYRIHRKELASEMVILSQKYGVTGYHAELVVTYAGKKTSDSLYTKYGVSLWEGGKQKPN